MVAFHPTAASLTLVHFLKEADTIPILSSITNIAVAIFKVAIDLGKLTKISENYVVRYVDEKSYFRILTLMFLPFIGNFIFVKFEDRQRKDAAANRGDSNLFLTPAYLNPQRRFEYLQKAAELGCPASMGDLGFIYSQQRDLAKAFYWFRRGAEAGDISSMKHLADCYRDKKYGKIDASESLFWYTRAASLGSGDAKKVLEQYSSRRKDSLPPPYDAVSAGSAYIFPDLSGQS